jgi:hypothetical protein
MTRFVVTLLAVAVAAELITRYAGWITSIYGTVANGLLLLGTLILVRLMSKIEDPQKFTQVYLASIVGKIFLACILIIVLIFIDKANARANVLFLFAMYVVFTVTEVIFLLMIRRAKKNQKISF